MMNNMCNPCEEAAKEKLNYEIVFDSLNEFEAAVEQLDVKSELAVVDFTHGGEEYLNG